MHIYVCVCSNSYPCLFVVYSFLISRNTIHSLECMHTYIVKYSKVYIHIYTDIYIKFLSCFFVEGFLGKFYDNDLTLKESCADGHASKLLI